MGDGSRIEWTDASWNPVTGCSKVSPGCAHCYAESLTRRFSRAWGVPDLPWTPANAATNVILHPERLDQPLRWARPRMIFVNSMSDLFHERVPSTFIIDVFNVMHEARQHIFQILTKRPDRMANMLRTWPLREHWPNVWVGTSIENRRFVDRADWLRLVPASVRFISAEPLLGPLVNYECCGHCRGCGSGGGGICNEPWIDWSQSLDLEGINWLIVGGESGHRHRPIKPDWVQELRDMAEHRDVAFFFKQWGGRTPKSGGRELDGRTWDEMPEFVGGSRLRTHRGQLVLGA